MREVSPQAAPLSDPELRGSRGVLGVPSEIRDALGRDEL
jgi:hypothetical protein